MKLLTTLAALALLLAPALAQDADTAAIAFLQKHAPKIHADIAALKTTAPSDYRSALDDAAKAAADYAKLADDPKAASAFLKMYALDFEAVGIADDIVASNDAAQTERLTKQLRGLIDASFEQWAIVEQARIARLEKELAVLKTEHSAAVASRAKVVDTDAAKLIEESRAFQKSKLNK